MSLLCLKSSSGFPSPSEQWSTVLSELSSPTHPSSSPSLCFPWSLNCSHIPCSLLNTPNRLLPCLCTCLLSLKCPLPDIARLIPSSPHCSSKLKCLPTSERFMNLLKKKKKKERKAKKEHLTLYCQHYLCSLSCYFSLRHLLPPDVRTGILLCLLLYV